MASDSHDLSHGNWLQEEHNMKSADGSAAARRKKEREWGWLPFRLLFGSASSCEPSPTSSISLSTVTLPTKQRIGKGWRQFFHLEVNEHGNDSENSFYDQVEDLASHVGDLEPPALDHPYADELSDIRLELKDIRDAITNHNLWVHDAAAMRRDIDDLRSSIWDHEDWMENAYGVVKQMQAKMNFMSMKQDLFENEDLRRQVGLRQRFSDDSAPDSNADSANGLSSHAHAQSDSIAAVVDLNRRVDNSMMNGASIGKSLSHSEHEAQGLAYPLDKQLLHSLRNLESNIEVSMLRFQVECPATNHLSTDHATRTLAPIGVDSMDADTMGDDRVTLRRNMVKIGQRVCDKCCEIEHMVRAMKGNNTLMMGSRCLTSVREKIGQGTRTNGSDAIDTLNSNSKHAFNSPRERKT